MKEPCFLFYLHSSEDIVEQLKPLSVAFHSDTLLVCQVPHKLDECSSLIYALAIVPGDAMNRLLNTLR